MTVLDQPKSDVIVGTLPDVQSILPLRHTKLTGDDLFSHFPGAHCTGKAGNVRGGKMYLA